MTLPQIPQRTTPGFAFPGLNRALLECIAVRKFGANQVKELLEFFGGGEPSCAFCGTTAVQRWDHLVPVTKGGDTVLGNMVLACGKCDDSKGDRPYDEWAVGSTPGSPRARGVADIEQRVARIREYVARYGYRPKSPEERLNEEEVQKFEVLRADLAKLRKDFDEFIMVYRRRSGLR